MIVTRFVTSKHKPRAEEVRAVEDMWLYSELIVPSDNYVSKSELFCF